MHDHACTHASSIAAFAMLLCQKYCKGIFYRCLCAWVPVSSWFWMTTVRRWRNQKIYFVNTWPPQVVHTEEVLEHANTTAEEPSPASRTRDCTTLFNDRGICLFELHLCRFRLLSCLNFLRHCSHGSGCKFGSSSVVAGACCEDSPATALYMWQKAYQPSLCLLHISIIPGYIRSVFKPLILPCT